MKVIWPLFVLTFYAVSNVKNIIITLKHGRVNIKSIVVLLSLITSFIVILNLPSLLRGIVGCIIATIFGMVFSVFDIIAFVSTAYFNPIEIFDFVVALGSLAGIFLSKIN